MICDAARFRRWSLCAGMLVSLVSSACESTVSLTVIGVSMKANDECQRVEHEYTVRAPDLAAEPKAWPAEFCGSLPDRPDEITCFLWSDNGKRWYPLTPATHLERTDPIHDHPDLGCWEEDLARWYDLMGGEDIPDRDDEHLDPGAWPPYRSHPMWYPPGAID